ncbi:hypothetical protein [Anaerophaga thermohalophila]|nr:hypothetical protein [Anaerophaga thermohalophila]
MEKGAKSIGQGTEPFQALLIPDAVERWKSRKVEGLKKGKRRRIPKDL